MEHATIIAIATPPGRAALGVIRVSGARALEVLRHVAPRAAPAPRVATLTSLEVDGHLVDEALVLFFQAPRSFTGEDVVELQTHGAPELLQLLLRTALALPGVRLAEPGEFTRRALLAGRLDLTRAEATLDLIEARSEAEVRAAAARLAGSLRTVLETLYRPLLALSAELEGLLDFPDEAVDAGPGVGERLQACLATARDLESQAASASRLRRRGLVVLYGPVNTGKSTLFNRLVGEARALVDEEAGTTRDAIEAPLEVGARVVSLVDTAGLREGPGRLEAMGIARTRERLSQADVAILLFPPGARAEELEGWRSEVPAERRLEVQGKADLAPGAPGGFVVSGRDGTGLPALLAELERRLADFGGAAGVATERHLEGLRWARERLERAAAALAGEPLELVAGEVGLALGAVGQLLGVEVSAERLDALFSRFCIGK